MMQIESKRDAETDGTEQRQSAPRCDAPPRRMRLEWNGVSGCRQIEVSRRLIATQGKRAVEREELFVGEVSEPFS